MNEDKSLEKRLADEEIDVIEYICLSADEELARAHEVGAEFSLGIEAECALWHNARDAHKNGKKLVLYTGAVPVELLYASGCVPVSLDFIQIKLARAVSHTRKLVLASEKIMPECFCSMDKSMLGVSELKRLGLEPDAVVFASPGCDGSRLSYPFVGKALGTPSFQFNIPIQKRQSSLRHIVDQFDALSDFLAQETALKLNESELRACIERANSSYDLLEKCAQLRKKTPCPLPGNLLVRNGWARAMACLPETVAFLEQEYKSGLLAADAGQSSCPGGEVYRAAFIQNMLWSSGEVTDWLEEKYGCACVMDAIGLVPYKYFEHPDDAQDCRLTMAGRMSEGLSFHGVTWSGPQILEQIDKLFEEYRPNVSIYAGHVGCRHTWAVVRMVSGFIEDKYGVSTLELPLDGIDMNYRSTDEIKRLISEYMDTVVLK